MGSAESEPSRKTLFAWLGQKDLAACEIPGRDKGPIFDAATHRPLGRVVILSAQPLARAQNYREWLESGRGVGQVLVRQTDVMDPWDFARIYHASVAAVQEEEVEAASRVFHLSPGTGAMSAAWIILAKTRFPAELIESSQRDPETGDYPIRTVNLPIDLSMELIGDILRRPGEDLIRLSESLPPAHAEFSKIIYKSRAMEQVVLRARQVAPFGNVPVLILGESGTGKELLARAIHAASPRSCKPFVPINCGAIPKELVESELFGHRQGAFTGANRERLGVFEAAHGGTLFLDEVGELPLHGQVRLLRALQEGKVMRLGDDRERTVDVRVISATNRDLPAEVAGGKFRLDLFHRLAVAVLKVPPLRARTEDIDLLVDHCMGLLPNTLGTKAPHGHRLMPSARRRLKEHPWPGNVRELQHALLRAAVWSTDDTIQREAIDDALLSASPDRQDYSEQPLGNGFDLRVLLDKMRGAYIHRALAAAGGNQSQAAALLGITRQTFCNWARATPGRDADLNEGKGCPR